jgi:glycosyltransferase involved in cell wall biosynthesis
MKGFDVLVRAVARLPQARAIIVGDGPERGALEHLARELGVGSRMEITGWTDDPRAYLARFDVFAMPSRFEGLPLALLEAMHASCPVVATPVGSIPDAVEDGHTGLLVPPDDDAALAAALLRLQGDSVLRVRLARSAAELARARFTTSTMARAYEALYAGVVGRRPFQRGIPGVTS